jgi:hypothetical protein
MNTTQTQVGVFAPLVAALAGFLAGKGVFGLDSATWAIILGALGTAGATIWGVVKTRPLALKDTVGHLDKTTVVTDAASANALPNNKDVIAVTPEIASAIKKAS